VSETRTEGSRAARWLFWVAILAATSVALLAFRTRLEEAHVALVLLLVVLGASAAGGRALGVTIAGAAFLLFDIVFLPPFNALRVADPRDWIVLLAFLTTGIVAAELLERLRREAERARTHAAEAERLEALRRADLLKGAQLASVSHDLRTPLTTIKGIANEIGRGGDASLAYVIEEEADRLTALVNDLLDLSQLALGEMRVQPALNTVDDAVGVALQRIEAAFPDRRIDTVLEEPWTDLVARFDLLHTTRILTNLLENAAKYAPPNGRIELHVSRVGDVLEFVVADTGPGILPTDVEHLFEPFARGGRDDGAHGTGLGLSIARRLANLQGGHLVYAPTAERASRFVLTLPAATAP